MYIEGKCTVEAPGQQEIKQRGIHEVDHSHQLVLRLDWDDVVALFSHVLTELHLLPGQLILACIQAVADVDQTTATEV